MAENVERRPRMHVPESAISTVKREASDRVVRFSPKDEGELVQIRRFLRQILPDDESLASDIEEICEAIRDENAISVGSWTGNELSGIAFGEEVGETLVISDLILNPARHGSGARARKIIDEMVRESGAKKVGLVCGEYDVTFFRGIFGEPLTSWEEDGEELFLFEASFA